MTFYPEGPEPGPPAPLLPASGWLPDPSDIDLERYWDGDRWTSRTRNRVTKVESPAPGWSAGGMYPSGTYNSGASSAAFSTGDFSTGPRDWSPGPAQYGAHAGGWSGTPSKRLSRWKGLGFAVLIALGVAVTFQAIDRAGESAPVAAPADMGLPAPAPAIEVPPLLPPGMPRDAVTPADIDYPVFGSTDLVNHLEAGMIAQQPILDVSEWAQRDGTDAIGEALLEAGTQNPYLYVYGWETSRQGNRVEVRPNYIYDHAEAERRRSQTAQAVTNGLVAAGVHGTMTDREKVTLIHDYIVDIADYDVGAFEAIEQGITTSSQVHQSQEAYGILVEGTAVCNGYAMAFSAMAHEAGLESITVTGSDSAGATGGSHAWNKVLIDDRWLLVDATWNDPIGWNGEALRDYLLLADDDPILATRIIGDDWVVSENLGQYAS